MPKKSDKEIIEKMQAAYEEFVSYMAQLEARASDLVKKAMKAGDKKKMDEALAKIKALTDK